MSFVANKSIRSRGARMEVMTNGERAAKASGAWHNGVEKGHWRLLYAAFLGWNLARIRSHSPSTGNGTCAEATISAGPNRRPSALRRNARCHHSPGLGYWGCSRRNTRRLHWAQARDDLHDTDIRSVHRPDRSRRQLVADRSVPIHHRPGTGRRVGHRCDACRRELARARASQRPWYHAVSLRVGALCWPPQSGIISNRSEESVRGVIRSCWGHCRPS